MTQDSTVQAKDPRRDGEGAASNTIENEILARISPADLAVVMDHAEEVEFQVKHEVFDHDEPMDSVYFPLTGMLSLVIALKHGPMIEALTVGKEGFSGPAILNGVTTARYRGVCQIEGKFLAIKTEAFQALLENTPDLNRRLHRYSQYASDVTAQSAACNSIHTIEQRCARWLLITSDAIRSTQFSLTQEFLSQMLAVRRPGVNVAMRALARRELISHRYAQVTLLDVEGLREASCECYETIKTKARELLN
jgi:CRP-like cAMP-binding protein